MLLAIDVGNTNTVFALYEGQHQRACWRCRTDARKSADEYAVLLAPLFGMAGALFADVEGVAVASVVPGADGHISDFCRIYLRREPLVADYKTVGVPVDLPDPTEVGADRLINALAVVRGGYRLPAIVLDFGTATTFDVIDARGHYSGGAIAPGVHVSVAALSRAAARLPNAHIERPRQAIGTSTRAAMESGIYWGYIGAVERIVAMLSAELSAAPFVLATGGLAHTFAADLPIIAAIDPDLTLKGLVYLYGDSPDSQLR